MDLDTKLYMHQDSAREFRTTMRLPVDLALSKTYAPSMMAVSNIREEFNELNKELYRVTLASPAACFAMREALFKELCDLVYVCYQLAAEAGWNLDEGMRLVHESNMTKLDDNGNPVLTPKGKIHKGPNYVPPDLSHLVSTTQAEAAPDA